MDVIDAIKQVVRPHRLNGQGNEMPLLWSDLKEFCNSLTDEQLQQRVRVYSEDKGGGVIAISETTDDFINPSGEVLEPKSIYADSEDEEDKEIAEDEPVVISKGTLFLELNF